MRPHGFRVGTNQSGNSWRRGEPRVRINCGSPRVLITFCTYNERENLQLLIPEILQQLPTADLLVIDDNSPDGTGAFAEELAARDARIHTIHRPGKLAFDIDL